MRRVAALVAFGLTALLLQASAWAHCIERPGSGRHDPAVTTTASALEALTFDPTCLYGFDGLPDPSIPLPAQLAGGTHDLLEVVHALRGGVVGPLHRLVVSARSPRATHAEQVVSWDPAIHRCVPVIEIRWDQGPVPTVDVTPPALPLACQGLQLHLRDPLTRGLRFNLPTTGPVTALNALGVPAGYRLALDVPSRPGAWIDLGPVDLWARATPLQRSFGMHQTVFGLRTDWSTGSLVLWPTGEWAQAIVFDELAVAAAAGELWLGRDHRVLADLTGYVDGRSRAMRLPDSVVDGWMEQRFGAAGHGMAPTRSEWLSIFAGLSLCHIREYQPNDPRVGDVIPPDARCVPMETLVELPGEVVGRGPRSYRATLVHQELELTQEQARRDGDEHQYTVPFGFGLAPASETFPRVVTWGDELRFEAPGARPWSTCVEGRCATVTGVFDTAVTTTAHASGLMEVRPGRLEGRAARQGIVILRFIVVDPSMDWVPVGLGRRGDGSHRWASVAHDETGVFGFSRRSSRLDFSLALAPAAIAAWNHRATLEPTSTPTMLVADLSLLASRIHPLGSTPPASVMLVARRDTECPAATARALRTAVPIDPRGLPIDAAVTLHLVQVVADDQPVRCLARARLRVRPERTIASRWPARTGLIGDLQAMVVFGRPVAVGLALPLLYGHLHVVGGFVVESAFAATALVDVERGAVQRAGLSFTSSVSWGVSSHLPRLLSVGLLVNLLTAGAGEHPARGLAPYVSLNLGSLFDLIGAQ